MESQRIENEYTAFGESNLWPVIYQRIGRRCQSYTYKYVEAKKPANKQLNRYRDVNPYDHSRVQLRKEGLPSDYINANLVQLERAGRQYILAQGPLVSTSGHFWLMVWEQRSSAIIMLNKVIEKGEIKCHWYWPQETGTVHKVVYHDVNMTVHQIKQENRGYYTVRRLRMTYLDTGECRDIWHFHYTTWPDFEVPATPTQFLHFLRDVRECGALQGADADGTEHGPAVVHCSAGIGRSGTFCLVDSVLVMIEKEGQANINVEEILLEMRRYRMGLLQTSEQLRFSYQAIVEGIRLLRAPPGEQDEVIYETCAPDQGDEATPPPPPPRAASLSRAPARPLPAIPASASCGNMDLASSDSESPLTTPKWFSPTQWSTPPIWGTPAPWATPPQADYPLSSMSESVSEEEEDGEEVVEKLEKKTEEGVRRRRHGSKAKAALAERVADMRERSRAADRRHALKRSLYKPLALSVGVGLFAIAGILIYVYSKH